LQAAEAKPTSQASAAVPALLKALEALTEDLQRLSLAVRAGR
jgi:hypothetical protein